MHVRLSDYLDDELSQDERLAIENHLTECAECRRTLQDLQRIVATAASLPPQPPATDLWTGIADRLETRVVPFDRGRRRFAFTLPELVAASVLLTVLSGGAVAWLMSDTAQPQTATNAGSSIEPAAPSGAADQVFAGGDPGIVSAVSLGDVQYDAAVVDLERALEAGRGRLDEATISVVEQNLTIIDGAIAEARSALLADPSNGYVSGHLVEARRRKLDLLRRAAALVAEAH